MIEFGLHLAAGLAEGLMIGIERGWHLRREEPGSRVAGIRTYTLLGFGGAISGLIAQLGAPVMGAIVAGVLGMLIIIGFSRDADRHDATPMVASAIVLGLGILAGFGQPSLAVAGGAIATFILATRSRSHGFIQNLSSTDVQAIARYAVIVAAVLPFLPDRQVGPLGAWNPFKLWLVVVLITGFSFAGYIANRTIGSRNGILAGALIGGAYSSTAVTQSFARRLGQGEKGPLTAGILIASAVMYLRVDLLVGILSPSTLIPFLKLTSPAAIVGITIAIFAWLRSSRPTVSTAEPLRNPIELAPALVFVAIVAAGAVATRWAQLYYGQPGTAASLFLTGTFDVDAAIVTLSGLPPLTIKPDLAAMALEGTIIANMAFKMLVVGLYARKHFAKPLLGLAASNLTLAAILAASILTD